MVHLLIRNESARKRLHRTDDLRRLAERVCVGEGSDPDAELSVLLCDDPFIAELNLRYRKINAQTDVLAFSQATERELALPALSYSVLGDIVISLETVERHCKGDRAAMREEIRLLFCHGLLHLLGYQHEGAQECERMAARQALYLGRPLEAVWPGRAVGA